MRAVLGNTANILCDTDITSHHMEKTETGLKGLYIREITTVIDLLICYY